MWQEFEHVPNFDLILFAGHGFTVNEYVTWQKLAAGLNFNMRVWDYHYYNGISYNIANPNIAFERKDKIKYVCLNIGSLF
jgi:hypothetical protein